VFVVSNDGVPKLGQVPDAELDSLDPRRAPYGATAIPVAGAHGEITVCFKQPGATGRRDVLVLEKPACLRVVSTAVATTEAPHSNSSTRVRLRVEMQQIAGDAGSLPASVAVVCFESSLAPGAAIDIATRRLLDEVAYTIRPGDLPGWFEYGEAAFPDEAFRHGHPDIATREQREAGIRGPSFLYAGLHAGIRASHFRPHRACALEPGERVLYEMHVGTFTPEGTFAAATHHMARLRSTGFTTLQIMPVDIGSGTPGWTYDQTRTGAVEAAYGGAAGLIEFVEHAHEQGLEVIVDKQYNHRGPEQDSRGEILAGMFTNATKWGPGLSGKDVESYPQVIKLIGEELAFWVAHFGVDGFRLDATNRLPWEAHNDITELCRQISGEVQKSLYVVSEYAECEPPEGRRVPTGHQYTDQTGRFVMKLLGISRASHVTSLPTDCGSVMMGMLKAARRGWWQPRVPPPAGGLRGYERATTLLWHHDWIGNRFGGERITDVVSFSLFKALAVWQALGQWTPLIFMGTERYVQTRWYFFTGHQDASTKNNTSAYYEQAAGALSLSGGRLHEFAVEAREAGLREALLFSSDGTLDGIDWRAFRQQTDRHGRPYMDHARRETFWASKLNWDHFNEKQRAIERLFSLLLAARSDARVKEDDPRNTQYKAWRGSERVLVLRRRDSEGRELVAFLNLGDQAVCLGLTAATVVASGLGGGYLASLDDGDEEQEWPCAGQYSLWLDTETEQFCGSAPARPLAFSVRDENATTMELEGSTAVVFSKLPL
jgi:glycosidase